MLKLQAEKEKAVVSSLAQNYSQYSNKLAAYSIIPDQSSPLVPQQGRAGGDSANLRIGG